MNKLGDLLVVKIDWYLVFLWVLSLLRQILDFLFQIFKFFGFFSFFIVGPRSLNKIKIFELKTLTFLRTWLGLLAQEPLINSDTVLGPNLGLTLNELAEKKGSFIDHSSKICSHGLCVFS